MTERLYKIVLCVPGHFILVFDTKYNLIQIQFIEQFYITFCQKKKTAQKTLLNCYIQNNSAAQCHTSELLGYQNKQVVVVFPCLIFNLPFISPVSVHFKLLPKIKCTQSFHKRVKHVLCVTSQGRSQSSFLSTDACVA